LYTTSTTWLLNRRRLPTSTGFLQTVTVVNCSRYRIQPQKPAA
jgi:hypothetical protein